MGRTAIYAEKWAAPKLGTPPAYSPAIKAGNLLFISGQVAVDSQGNLVGEGDPERQVRQVYENIKAVLEAAGGSLDDVVKQTVFITNVEHGDKIRDVRRRYFKPPYPASATVVVKELLVKELLLEVEAIAVIE